METRNFRIPSAVLAFLLLPLVANPGPCAWGAAPRPAPLTEQLVAAEKRSNWVVAGEIARRLLAEKPDDLDLLTRLARYQHAAGDYGRATDTLKRIVEITGEEGVDVLEIRGDIAKSEDRPADALSAYQLALRVAPDSVRLLEKLASHYSNMGDHETAAIYYGKLVTLREDAGDHVQLAQAAVRSRDWNAMIDHLVFAGAIGKGREAAIPPKFGKLLSKAIVLGQYDRRIKSAPQDIESILGRAALFHSCEFYSEALDDAKRAARIDGRSPHLRIALAYYYRAAGELKKGAEFNVNVTSLGTPQLSTKLMNPLADYDRALKAEPDDQAMLRRRAALLLDHAQAPLALEDIDRALKAEPDSVSTQLLKVRALRAVSRSREARELVRELAVRAPDHEDVLAYIGAIQMEDGLYAEAIATFDKILALHPTDKKVLDARLQCQRRLQQQPAAPAAEGAAAGSGSL